MSRPTTKQNYSGLGSVMGWIIKSVPKETHHCALPEVSSYGDVWQCDSCLNAWTVAQTRFSRKSWNLVRRTELGIRNTSCGRGICALGALHTGNCRY